MCSCVQHSLHMCTAECIVVTVECTVVYSRVYSRVYSIVYSRVYSRVNSIVYSRVYSRVYNSVYSRVSRVAVRNLVWAKSDRQTTRKLRFAFKLKIIWSSSGRISSIGLRGQFIHLLSTTLLNGPLNKNCDQRSDILHTVKDPQNQPSDVKIANLKVEFLWENQHFWFVEKC